MADGVLPIQVVYATVDVQSIVSVPFESGITAGRAVDLSGLADRYPEIRQRSLVLGVFGERVAEDRVLEPGDRVEICRPLLIDPRDMRRIRHAEGKAVGGPRSGAAE